jgi:hypothetical protein
VGDQHPTYPTVDSLAGEAESEGRRAASSWGKITVRMNPCITRKVWRVPRASMGAVALAMVVASSIPAGCILRGLDELEWQGPDAGLGEAGTVAETDAGTVAETDAGTVAETDAGTVAEADAGTVAGADAGTVAGADAGTVAGTDAGTDVGTDAGTESPTGNLLGQACTADSHCASTHCANGLCCDAPCNETPCRRCDSASSKGVGHCGLARAGTECHAPSETCSGKCAVQRTTYSCAGDSEACLSSVTTASVESGRVCSLASNSVVPVSKEVSCDTGNDCSDGACHASLWWTGCDGRGNCRLAADKTDALIEPINAAAGATLTKFCATNGTSLCSSAAHCAGDAVCSGFVCDGNGQCNVDAAQKTSCGNYTCDRNWTRCKTECSIDADCAGDLVCTPSTCHWDWEWAAWKVSATGNFTVNADDVTVKDNVTGLVWQRGFSDATKTWNDAKTYCRDLGLSGGGWRLPTRIELLSIVNLKTKDPAIDTTAFPKTPSAWFWTSTPFAGDSGYAWGVFFGHGSSDDYGTTGTGWVRCVR